MLQFDFSQNQGFTIVRKTDAKSIQKLYILHHTDITDDISTYYVSLPGLIDTTYIYPSKYQVGTDMTQKWNDEMWRPLRLKFFVQEKIRYHHRTKYKKYLLLILSNFGPINQHRDIVLEIIRYL